MDYFLVISLFSAWKKKQKHNIGLKITNSTGNPVYLLDVGVNLPKGSYSVIKDDPKYLLDIMGFNLPKGSYKVIKDGEKILITLPENFTGTYDRDIRTKDGFYQIFIDYPAYGDEASIMAGIRGVAQGISDFIPMYDKNAKETNFLIDIDLEKDLRESEIDFNLLQK